MLSYMICGCTLRSDLPLPELALANGTPSEFTFRFFAHADNVSEPYDWLNNWSLPDGQIWLAVAKLASGYLLRFPAFADFVVSFDGRVVCCYSKADTPLETIRHLFLNQ